MTKTDGRKRVIIEGVSPEIDGGRFAIKRAVGEKVNVRADIFLDGHDSISAALLYRREDEAAWRKAPMKPLVNDRWEGEFQVEELGLYYYTIKGWVDHFQTWQRDLGKKFRAGLDVRTDIAIGAKMIEEVVRSSAPEEAARLSDLATRLKDLATRDIEVAVSLAMGEEVTRLMSRHTDSEGVTTYERELPVAVDGERAIFSAWYEFFPRSCVNGRGDHGTFRNCEKLLPEISRMGFDVIYLPPIHPIGRTNRKGRNNSLQAGSDDPGSPWAIGAVEGGHKAVHPDLGTVDDFEKFVARAREFGVDVAMDIAFQCSPDHPYVKDHPQWFRWRPDGTIQFAENPPKKYEDIVPFDFENRDWQGLWDELKSVVFFWIGKGVRIFRVDNPHTKPFRFWDWLIAEVKREHPEVIFLAEAFTRPKVMFRLAKGGFTHSYTYFTWRNTKQELTEYMEELKKQSAREFFRPNFWPNTPDILHEYLQYGGRPAFVVRLVLAATLSSNYGIYGPAFEHQLSEPFPGKEEYVDSEKYEIKLWDWDRQDSLREFISRVNLIRRENPALQRTWNVRFHETDNDNIIFYSKTTEDLSNVLLIVVNLDPFHGQSCRVRVPLGDLEMSPTQPYLVHDLISDDKFIWHGEWNTVELSPHILPAYIFRVRSRLRREQDFDYFM